MLRLLPRASACGLGPGLSSPSPLGRSCLVSAERHEVRTCETEVTDPLAGPNQRQSLRSRRVRGRHDAAGRCDPRGSWPRRNPAPSLAARTPESFPWALESQSSAKITVPARKQRTRRPGKESERLNFFPDTQNGRPDAQFPRMTVREVIRGFGNLSEPPGFLVGCPDAIRRPEFLGWASGTRQNAPGALKTDSGAKKPVPGAQKTDPDGLERNRQRRSRGIEPARGVRPARPDPFFGLPAPVFGSRIRFERSRSVLSRPGRSSKKPGPPDRVRTAIQETRRLGQVSEAPADFPDRHPGKLGIWEPILGVGKEIQPFGLLPGATGPLFSRRDRYFRAGPRSKSPGKRFTGPGSQTGRRIPSWPWAFRSRGCIIRAWSRHRPNPEVTPTAAWTEMRR